MACQLPPEVWDQVLLQSLTKELTQKTVIQKNGFAKPTDGPLDYLSGCLAFNCPDQPVRNRKRADLLHQVYQDWRSRSAGTDNQSLLGVQRYHRFSLPIAFRFKPFLHDYHLTTQYQVYKYTMQGCAQQYSEEATSRLQMPGVDWVWCGLLICVGELGLYPFRPANADIVLREDLAAAVFECIPQTQQVPVLWGSDRALPHSWEIHLYRPRPTPQLLQSFLDHHPGNPQLARTHARTFLLNPWRQPWAPRACSCPTCRQLDTCPGCEPFKMPTFI